MAYVRRRVFTEGVESVTPAPFFSVFEVEEIGI
jgi:hypothetical protein